MPERRVVQGQHVTEGKLIRAKQLRHEMTPAERRLWGALRANQLFGLHFRRQQVIDGFIADFYCHAVGLIVEVDGPIHDEQAEYDAERDRIISARNLRIERVTNDEVMRSLPAVLARIIAAVQSHLTPRPPSLAGKGED